MERRPHTVSHEIANDAVPVRDRDGLDRRPDV
jgi:hypothetical protein